MGGTAGRSQNNNAARRPHQPTRAARPCPPVRAALPRRQPSGPATPTPSTPAEESASSTATLAVAAPDGFLGRAFVTALQPGPARFYLSWLPGAGAALGLLGAVHAHDAVHAGLAAVPPSWLAALPASASVGDLYAAHPALLDGAVDSAAGLVNLLLLFVLVPAADALFGREPEAELPPATAGPPPPAAGGLLRKASALAASTPGHPPVAAAAARAADAAADAAFDAYRVPLWGVGAIHLALLAAGATLVAPAANPVATLAAACGVGAWGGMVFTVMHELLHSPHPVERRLADFLLSTYGYAHWRDGHLAHHRNVGTPGDPATARLGESLFEFMPRCVVGNVRDAVAAAEGRALGRARRAAIAAGEDPDSKAVKAAGAAGAAATAAGWVAAPASLAILAGSVGGPAAVAFWAVQAVVGIYMLHSVDYIEHYGLVRAELPAGGQGVDSAATTAPAKTKRYEKVAPHDSWNANFMATNAITFRLQRHSDHHAHAERAYHKLRDVGAGEASYLPMSYPAMMILAQSPPLWRAVMDPHVERARARAAAVRAGKSE